MFSVQNFTAVRMLRPNSIHVQQCVLQAGRNTLQNLGSLSSAGVVRSSVWSDSCYRKGRMWCRLSGEVSYKLCFIACILQRCCYYPSIKSDLPDNENLILLSCKFPEKALSDYYKVFFSHQPMFLFIFSKYHKGISVFSPFQYKKDFLEQRKNSCSSWAI